jgi:hypothetical protein
MAAWDANRPRAHVGCGGVKARWATLLGEQSGAGHSGVQAVGLTCGLAGGASVHPIALALCLGHLVNKPRGGHSSSAS